MTHPEGGAGTGPGRHYCPNERPHAAHLVRPRRRNWTPFHCPGLAVGELDRLLDETFGPLLTRAGS